MLAGPAGDTALGFISDFYRDHCVAALSGNAPGLGADVWQQFPRLLSDWALKLGAEQLVELSLGPVLEELIRRTGGRLVIASTVAKAALQRIVENAYRAATKAWEDGIKQCMDAALKLPNTIQSTEAMLRCLGQKALFDPIAAPNPAEGLNDLASDISHSPVPPEQYFADEITP